MATTILIVDDHPVFRKGLSLLLESEPDFHVVGEVGSGRDAIDEVAALAPEVVIMDINMPDINGIEATRRILHRYAETRIVALSIHSSGPIVKDMLAAGAGAYLLKESAPEELIEAVQAVARGETYLSRKVTGIVVTEMVSSGSECATSDRVQDTADATVDAPTIIPTKYSRPPVNVDHVSRPRLSKLLNKGLQTALILISAPAGYGKTAMVSDWLDNSTTPSAWLSLESEDDEMLEFVRLFLAAIEVVLPGGVPQTSSLVDTATVPPPRELAYSLVNELSPVTGDFVIVLDDFHHIRDASLARFFGHFVTHTPPCVHLVLIGRKDPFLPISSLRARGQVAELRAADLKFQPAEAAIYFKQALGTEVAPSLAAEWADKTEGWITGLRLAAMAFKHRGEILTSPEIEGSPQYILAYLFDEVFARQPEEMREWLLTTSVLDRLCGPLCEAVHVGPETGKSSLDGWQFITRLHTENLFVVSLDTENRWFRYHQLFQRLLQNQLRRCRPQDVARLHARASQWFEREGSIKQALHHALKAGRPEQAAGIVERHRHAAMSEDRWQTLAEWLDMLPVEIRQARPALLMAKLFVLGEQFLLPEMASVIERIEMLARRDTLPEALQAELDYYRGILNVWFHCDGAAGCRRLEAVRERIPLENRLVKGRIEMHIGLAHQMTGQTQGAIDELATGLKSSDTADTVFRSRLMGAQAMVNLLSGSLLAAAQTARQMAAEAEHGSYPQMMALGRYLQANALFQAGRRRAALSVFSTAEKGIDRLNRRIAVDLMAGKALTHQELQQSEEAAATLATLLDWTREKGDTDLIVIGEACRARLALQAGDTGSALRWARSFNEVSHPSCSFFFLEIPELTQIRIWVVAGSDEKGKRAVERLTRMRSFAESRHFRGLLIEILVLLALAHTRQRDNEQAQEVLGKALSLGQPGSWVRPFVEAGTPLSSMLQRQSKRHGPNDYTDLILSAFDQGEASAPSEERQSKSTPFLHSGAEKSDVSSPEMAEKFTNRELDILELLAKRMQNKEIAAELFISPETVKTHLTNIYQKLAIHGRRRAVIRARELGIIPPS